MKTTIYGSILEKVWKSSDMLKGKWKMGNGKQGVEGYCPIVEEASLVVFRRLKVIG